MTERLTKKQRYLRDTACNRILRTITRKPMLGYQEERPDWDVSSIDQYLIKPESDSEKRNRSDLSSQHSRASDDTAVETPERSARAKDGDKAEKQKSEKSTSKKSAHDATGADKDTIVVDWYGDNDPENPQNWTNGYKAFQLFNICAL